MGKNNQYKRNLLVSFEINGKSVGEWIHRFNIFPTEFSLNTDAQVALNAIRVTDVIRIGLYNEVEKSQRFEINPFTIADFFPGVTIDLVPQSAIWKAIEIKITNVLNDVQEIVDL